MRPSTSSLLKLRPIPASKLDLYALRLPASQRPLRRRVIRTVPTTSTTTTTATSAEASASAEGEAEGEAGMQDDAAPQSSKVISSTPTFPQREPIRSIAELLLRKEEQLRSAAVEAAASGVDVQGVQGSSGREWPGNLRIIKHVNQREVFWKVPTEQRVQLKKLLREE